MLRVSFFFIGICCCISSSYGQDAFEDYHQIDTTQYGYSDRFYVKYLRFTEAEDPNKAHLTWQAHSSIKKFMIEIRDSLGNLHYRQLHSGNKFLGPVKAHYTVQPYANNLLGRPRAIRHEIIPLKEQKVRQEATLSRKLERKNWLKRRQKAKELRLKRVEEVRQKKGTIRLVLVGTGITGIAILACLVIFLIRYFTKHKDPRANRTPERDYSDGWE